MRATSRSPLCKGLANNAFLDAVEPLSFGARLLLPGRGGHAQRCPKSKCGPDEACAVIDKGVPVMTGASVELPATEYVGRRSRCAGLPRSDADTVDAFPGPYRYTSSRSATGSRRALGAVASKEPSRVIPHSGPWIQPRCCTRASTAKTPHVVSTRCPHVGAVTDMPSAPVLRRRPVPQLVRLTPADNHVTLDGSCRAGRGATPPFVFHRVLLDGSLGTLLDTLRRFPNG